MIPGRRDSIALRIERIERALIDLVPPDAPLSRREQRELVELEAGRAARFAGDHADWPLEQLEDFMAWSADGQSARLAHLRFRNLPREQREEITRECEAIDSMSQAQLDAYMAAQAERSSDDAC